MILSISMSLWSSFKRLDELIQLGERRQKVVRPGRFQLCLYGLIVSCMCFKIFPFERDGCWWKFDARIAAGSQKLRRTDRQNRADEILPVRGHALKEIQQFTIVDRCRCLPG